MNTLNTALEDAKKDLKEAQEKIKMIERLSKYITVGITRLGFYSGEVWVDITEMSLKDGIAYFKKLKIKDFYLSVMKYTHGGTERSELKGLIVIDGVQVKIDIPINDIKEPVLQFRYRGSTSRSKITGVVLLRTVAPFKRSMVYQFNHEVRFML